jgi:hypothetical protein
LNGALSASLSEADEEPPLLPLVKSEGVVVVDVDRQAEVDG